MEWMDYTMNIRKKSSKGEKPQSSTNTVVDSDEERMEMDELFHGVKANVKDLTLLMVTMFTIRRDGVSAEAAIKTLDIFGLVFDLHEAFNRKEITCQAAFDKLNVFVGEMSKVLMPLVAACVHDMKITGELELPKSMRPKSTLKN